MKRPIPFCMLILILAAALCFSACAENKTPGDVFMPIDESDAYPSETVRADFSTEAPKDYTLPVDETTAAPDSDAALDVLNHYSNMFIASKVNNYLNIRNAPSTEGAIIGKLTKDAGGEILEDAGDGWYRIQSGGIEGFVSGSYIITGDEHYRDYAEFIHSNTRNANDVYGDFGYAVRGVSWEGGQFSDQEIRSQHHWLPWVTYVELDPASRLMDTFGAFDIAGCERLSKEEKERRNRIYEDYARFEGN